MGALPDNHCGAVHPAHDRSGAARALPLVLPLLNVPEKYLLCYFIGDFENLSGRPVTFSCFGRMRLTVVEAAFPSNLLVGSVLLLAQH